MPRLNPCARAGPAVEPLPLPVHPPPIITGPQLHAASLLTLQGPGAYDAAVHCASVSAARRMMHGGSPEAGCQHPHRSQSMPSTGSAEGVPVRQTMTEPPAAQARSHATFALSCAGRPLILLVDASSRAGLGRSSCQPQGFAEQATMLN